MSDMHSLQMTAFSIPRRNPLGRVVGGVTFVVLLLVTVGCGPRAGSVPTPVAYVGPTQDAAPTPLPPGEGEAGGAPLAARVDDIPILLRDYEKQVTEWETAFIGQSAQLTEADKQAMLAQGRRQVLDVMIEQALIERAAAAEGVQVSDAELDAVITRDIQENGGQEKFEAWLQANNWTRDEYRTRQRSMMISFMMFERVTRNVPTQAEQVHARHILVADSAQANEILSQLQAGTDFGQLARQHSLDPSTKESGGDLGFFPRGTLVVPEVEEVAFALSVGQISQVISSPMGFHIVQVVERVQDKPLTEEAWQALKETTFRRWVSELWQQANIEVLIQL
jgi:parvulin-like peptidyl-prolyl isomerase